MISSATPGAGKTFVSANLAAVLRLGQARAADRRRSAARQPGAPFGLKRRDGLSELILGSVELENAIHKGVLPHLDVMATGALPADPTGLLASDAFSRVLEMVSARYDVVIVDTPPALLASETAEMATCMGTLLMVARAGDNELGDLTESVKQLRYAGAHFQGVVLNALDTRQRYYGSLAYRYGGYRLRVHEYPSVVAELPRPATKIAAAATTSAAGATA
jgi:tyrosine-protein kinase Etk/Wzc